MAFYRRIVTVSRLPFTRRALIKADRIRFRDWIKTWHLMTREKKVKLKISRLCVYNQYFMFSSSSSVRHRRYFKGRWWWWRRLRNILFLWFGHYLFEILTRYQIYSLKNKIVKIMMQQTTENLLLWKWMWDWRTEPIRDRSTSPAHSNVIHPQCDERVLVWFSSGKSNLLSGHILRVWLVAYFA